MDRPASVLPINLLSDKFLNLDTDKIHEMRFSCDRFLLEKGGWRVKHTRKPNSILTATETVTEPPDVEKITSATQTRIEVKRHGHWRSLPSAIADAIIDGMCAGHSKFIYRTKHKGRPGHLDSSGYAVDMTTMTHTNLDTRRTRATRLRVGPFQLMQSGWSARPRHEDEYCFLSKGRYITTIVDEDESD